MRRLLKTPKIQLVFALFLIFITALVRQPSILLLFRFIFGVVLAIGIDIALLKIRKIEPIFPSAGLVSGCIIGLLLAPSLPLVELFMALSFAMVSKHFLRFNNKHVFNPAAFGLFLGGMIFGHDASWWGTSFQQLAINNYQLFFSFLILLLPGYISCFKMRRFKIVISFFLIYNLLSFFFNQNLIILDPTVIFFALVMLPEPMTTPSKPAIQIFYGIFVAIAAILVSFPTSNLPVRQAGFQSLISRLIPDPLIVALLVGNALFFKLR